MESIKVVASICRHLLIVLCLFVGILFSEILCRSNECTVRIYVEYGKKERWIHTSAFSFDLIPTVQQDRYLKRDANAFPVISSVPTVLPLFGTLPRNRISLRAT